MSAVRPCAAGAIPAASELQVTARALSSQADNELSQHIKTTTLPYENPATGGGRRRRATGRGQQGLLSRSPVARPVRLESVRLQSTLTVSFLDKNADRCWRGSSALLVRQVCPLPSCSPGSCFLPPENPVLSPLPRLLFLGGLQWAQRGLCMLSATFPVTPLCCNQPS